MPITVICPGCGKLTHVPGKAAGMKGRCRACGTTVHVPRSGTNGKRVRGTFLSPRTLIVAAVLLLGLPVAGFLCYRLYRWPQTNEQALGGTNNSTNDLSQMSERLKKAGGEAFTEGARNQPTLAQLDRQSDTQPIATEVAAKRSNTEGISSISISCLRTSLGKVGWKLRQLGEDEFLVQSYPQGMPSGEGYPRLRLTPASPTSALTATLLVPGTRPVQELSKKYIVSFMNGAVPDLKDGGDWVIGVLESQDRQSLVSGVWKSHGAKTIQVSSENNVWSIRVENDAGWQDVIKKAGVSR